MIKNLYNKWKNLHLRGKVLIVGIIGGLGLVMMVGIAYLGINIYSQTQSNSTPAIRRWFDAPSSRPELITERIQCPEAPFILPSEGFIGLLWRDPAGPYDILNRHTGIDVFGDGEEGEVPVYAIYDGYLTRLGNWRSSVIIRHEDPLVDGRQIWSYYTHLASEDGTESFIDDAFPAGTGEVFVEQGTLLGYQGKYAGNADFSVGLHVHMSLVTSEEDGSFKNEAVLGNTIDPSPYFGMPLNIDSMPERPIQCVETTNQ